MSWRREIQVNMVTSEMKDVHKSCQGIVKRGCKQRPLPMAVEAAGETEEDNEAQNAFMDCCTPNVPLKREGRKKKGQHYTRYPTLWSLRVQLYVCFSKRVFFVVCI